MEQYFDNNLWVGDSLYFVPFLSRLDSEFNKGAINFDDIYVAQPKHEGDKHEGDDGHKHDDDDDDDKHKRRKEGEKEEQVEVSHAPIKSGYQGFDWSGLEVVDVDQHVRRKHRHNWQRECSRGLMNSLISLDNVAVNLGGEKVKITSSCNGLFSFKSAFFTAVCSSPQKLFISALRGGEELFNVTIILTDSLPIAFSPHWNDIDTLVLTSSLLNPFGGPVTPEGKTIFAIDDIILVPDFEVNLVMNTLNDLILQQSKKMGEVIDENKRLRAKVDVLGGMTEENKRMVEENEKMKNKVNSFEEVLNDLKKRIQ